MKDAVNACRRKVLKLGAIALVVLPATAFAEKNERLRKMRNYQNAPLGDRQCSTCLQFVVGTTLADLGGCNVIPGDTEISPGGYCTAWARKP